MSDLFYNPYKPTFDDILIKNEYDNPEYTYVGNVESSIHKKWINLPHPKDRVTSFVTPDEQRTIHFNKFGKIEFIEIDRESTMSRHYIGGHHHYKPNIEQPMSYYKQCYSGGIHFIYNKENKLIEYFSDLKFRGALRGVKREFLYDDNGNAYVKSDNHKLIFNESGQIQSITYCKESDEYYEKILYNYDEYGRLTKKMGYGYLSGEDEKGHDEIVYYTEKGIHLLYTADYVYSTISATDTLCVREINFWDETERSHVKQEIIFDSNGYKKYHRRCTFDGSIHSTNNYSFTFDQIGNWIKAVVDTTFGASSNQKNQKTYIREINYK